MSDKAYPDALTIGHRLHWYELEHVLGQGGFGITYLARDTNLDRRVAIKEYLPADYARRQDDATVRPRSDAMAERYAWGLERFALEARTLARFDHPSIVRVHSVFEANNTAYMVMRFEAGENLASLLDRRGSVPERQLLDCLLAILDGLQLVHDAGFIHRDIKPENIYMRSDGTPVLLDFGSARQALGRANTMTILVAPGYAPLEQYYGDPATQGPWTDLYGLGATCYRAIAGCPPADAIARAKGVLGSTRDLLQAAAQAGRGRYSERFLQAVDHALQLNERDRPQSIAEWRRELVAAPAVAALAAAGAVSSPPASAVPITPRPPPVTQVNWPDEPSAAAQPAVPGAAAPQFSPQANAPPSGTTAAAAGLLPRWLPGWRPGWLLACVAAAVGAVLLAWPARPPGPPADAAVRPDAGFAPAARPSPAELAVAGSTVAGASATVPAPPAAATEALVTQVAASTAGAGVALPVTRPGVPAPTARGVADGARRRDALATEAGRLVKAMAPSVSSGPVRATGLAALAGREPASASPAFTSVILPTSAALPARSPAAMPATTVPAQVAGSAALTAETRPAVPALSPTLPASMASVASAPVLHAAFGQPASLPNAVILATPAAAPTPAVTPGQGTGDGQAARRRRDEQLDSAEAAMRRGDHRAAADLLAPWAAAGAARAQLLLGRVHEERGGRLTNHFEAYIWYAIAARAGEPGAAALKERAAARLQPAEIRQAEQVIERWKPRPAATSTTAN